MRNKLPLIVTSFLLLLTSCENVMPLYLVYNLNSIVNQAQDLGDVRTLLIANKPSGVTDVMINEFINFFNEYKPE